MGSCGVRSSYLTTLLLGRLSPVLCTFFGKKLITALLDLFSEGDGLHAMSNPIFWEKKKKKKKKSNNLSSTEC